MRKTGSSIFRQKEVEPLMPFFIHGWLYFSLNLAVGLIFYHIFKLRCKMVPSKLPVPGCPTIWITGGQGPTALAVGAGGGLFGHFPRSLGDGPI